jgi:hypothetical protein
MGSVVDGGLRVAAQGTGHGARPLGSLAGTLLVKTAAMRRVSVDPGAKVARAEKVAGQADARHSAGTLISDRLMSGTACTPSRFIVRTMSARNHSST